MLKDMSHSFRGSVRILYTLAKNGKFDNEHVFKKNILSTIEISSGILSHTEY